MLYFVHATRPTVAFSKDFAHNQSVTNSRIYVHAATQTLQILKIFVFLQHLRKKAFFVQIQIPIVKAINLRKN